VIRDLIARLHDWSGKQLEQAAHPEWMRQDLELIDELDINPKRKQWLRSRVLNGSHLWNVMAEEWDDL
jgi:hypothetical protein